MVEIKEIYCPVCDADYRLGFEQAKNRMVVVCDCDEAQTLDSFISGFEEEVADVEKGRQDGRAFQ